MYKNPLEVGNCNVETIFKGISFYLTYTFHCRSISHVYIYMCAGYLVSTISRYTLNSLRFNTECLCVAAAELCCKSL